MTKDKGIRFAQRTEKLVRKSLEIRLTDYVLSETIKRTCRIASLDEQRYEREFPGQLDKVISEIIAKMFPGRTEKSKVSLSDERDKLLTNLIIVAFQKSGGDEQKVARLLGVPSKLLRHHLAFLKIDKNSLPQLTESVEPRDLRGAKENLERRLVEKALSLETSTVLAAKRLDISERELKYLMSKLGINPPV